MIQKCAVAYLTIFMLQLFATTGWSQIQYDFIQRVVTANADNPCNNDASGDSTFHEGSITFNAMATVDDADPGCGAAETLAMQSSSIASDFISGIGSLNSTTSDSSSASGLNILSTLFPADVPLFYTLEGFANGDASVVLFDGATIAELGPTPATLTGVLSPGGNYGFEAAIGTNVQSGATEGGDYSFTFTVAVPEPSSVWPVVLAIPILLRRRLSLLA